VLVRLALQSATPQANPLFPPHCCQSCQNQTSTLSGAVTSCSACLQVAGQVFSFHVMCEAAPSTSGKLLPPTQERMAPCGRVEWKAPTFSRCAFLSLFFVLSFTVSRSFLSRGMPRLPSICPWPRSRVIAASQLANHLVPSHPLCTFSPNSRSVGVAKSRPAPPSADPYPSHPLSASRSCAGNAC
jgi:hypothetical protein